MGKIIDLFNGTTLPQQKKRQVLKLDAEYEEVQAQNQVLKSENLKLQADVNPLRRTIEEMEQKIAQLTASAENALTFNQSTGTYIDPKTGIHFCTKCLSADKRSPLRNGNHGWRCMVCNADYFDPARPEPPIRMGYEPLA